MKQLKCGTTVEIHFEVPRVQKLHLFKLLICLNVAFESDRNFGLVLISSNLFVKLLEGIVGKKNPCSTSSLF